AVKVVSKEVEQFFNKDKALIIITHHKDILADIKPDIVHVLKDGEMVKTSDASLIDEIESQGYENL
ncbi:ABC transporter ATP-binding protein, partial [Criibacterium bergeronii]